MAPRWSTRLISCITSSTSVFRASHAEPPGTTTVTSTLLHHVVRSVRVDALARVIFMIKSNRQRLMLAHYQTHIQKVVRICACSVALSKQSEPGCQAVGFQQDPIPHQFSELDQQRH